MIERSEVAILGGGLAGQCLARHLLQAGVEGPIVILDRTRLPIDASTLKLGESTVEAGAWYLGKRLGLHDRLLDAHEMKFGLRFYFSAGGNEDVGERLELGPQHSERFHRGLRPPAYQVHRGRLEHMLGQDNADAGVHLWGECSIQSMDLDPEQGHTIVFERGGQSHTLRARWLVDASGRAGILTGQLGLQRPLAHEVRVAQGWLAGRIDPEQWTHKAEFHARLDAGLRWRSTVHLIGPGYTIWLIPVGAHMSSIGVVANTPGGTLDGIDDAQALQDWLAAHEPQLAAEVSRLGWQQPPGFLHSQAQVSRRIVSAQRFAVCGEAAAHLDPLYSSGFDLLAIANEMIVATIVEDRQGRPLAPICERRNVIFAQMVRQLLVVYEDAYRLLDAPRIATHKITWDVATYLGYLAPLVMSGSFSASEPLAEHMGIAARAVRLNQRMQQLFTDWRAQAGQAQHPVPSVNLAHLPPVARCFARLGDMQLDDPPARWTELLRDNLQLLEDQAVATFLDAAADLGLTPPSGVIDAYAIGLDPRLWPAQGLNRGQRARAPGARVAATRSGMQGEGSLSSLEELEPETPLR